MIFKYTSLAALREEGFTPTELSDARGLKLIAKASEIINELTGQWFSPVRRILLLDGRGTILSLGIPLLELLTGPEQVENGSFPTEGLEDRYSVYEPVQVFGTVEELPRLSARPASFPVYVDARPDSRSVIAQDGRVFPAGVGNVKIEGFFGWMSEPSNKRASTLAAIFEIGDTTVTLDDGTGFSPGLLV